MTPDELRARAEAEERVHAAALAAGDRPAALRALNRAELLRQLADEGAAPDRGDPMAAARRAGLPSVRAVAAKLGKDPTFLSRVLRGLKPMPADLAEAFEQLTGYPAASWRR